MPLTESRNRITLSGVVASEPVYSHTAYGEDFYLFSMRVVRKSQTADEITVLISERLFGAGKLFLSPSDRIRIEGQIRTYNEKREEKTHLKILVFCREISRCDEGGYDENSLMLDGFLCRKPVYRRSPLGREICDLMLAVNRPYGKSDYIPCVVWGRNAAYAATLQTGDHLRLYGRFQSREYRKKTAEGEYELRVAYEVSVNMMEMKEPAERGDSCCISENRL